MDSNKDMKTFLAQEEAKLAEDLKFVENIKNQAKENKIKKILTIVVVVFTLIITAAYNIGSEYDREKSRKYDEAQMLQEKGMYQDAIDVYDKLYGYKNSDSFINECENLLKTFESQKTYENAMDRFNEESYQEAAALFESLKDYSDAKDKAKESYYKYGEKCVADTDYENAYYAFNSAKGYSNADELAAKFKFAVTKVGSTLTYGKYEQDNDTTNGAEDIVWYVLYKEKDKALLLSKYVLDTIAYDENFKTTETPTEPFTYANSTVRKFVNETFYNEAFSEEEKKTLITFELTETDTAGNELAKSENNVFILTSSLVEQYVTSSTMKNAYGTKAALNATSTAKTIWWTATIDEEGTRALTLTSQGNNARTYLNSICGVRPAIWVDFVE